MSQLLLEGIVLIESEVRVTDHTRLDMEAAISDEYNYLTRF